MKKSKSKRKVFDVKLDAYEKEISDAIDQALEKGSLKRADHAAKNWLLLRTLPLTFCVKMRE
jgi:hypothetical protein